MITDVEPRHRPMLRWPRIPALAPALLLILLACGDSGGSGGSDCDLEPSPLTVSEVIDRIGDGGEDKLDGPRSVAVNPVNGNLYVSGYLSNNAFRVEPDGTVTKILDEEGADPTIPALGGAEDDLGGARVVAVDSTTGDAFVVGDFTNNVFRVTPALALSVFAEPSGVNDPAVAEAIAPVFRPIRVAVDAASNVYIANRTNDNVLRISSGLAVTEIIDTSGLGGVDTLEYVEGLAVNPATGDVYVSGRDSNNVFRIDNPGTCSTTGTACTITEIIDETGDGAGNPLSGSAEVAVDPATGNVYVAGFKSQNVFEITPGGVITEIIDESGAGTCATLVSPVGVAVDATSNVYVTGYSSDNVFQITPGGVITEILNAIGVGGVNVLEAPAGVVFEPVSGNLYVAGYGSDNVFEVDTTP